ncbi:MAG TPA: dihydroorotate dehydrogenase electron transfer subunit [Nevskiaceae bacterium]|nr:dihydroorotate dehydrogenase electron transfer subunit [Nevskiaceae bacterium]
MKTSLPQPTTITRVVTENDKVKTFVTQAKIKAQPGQFILVWLPRIAEKPFAIVDNNPLTFTVAKVGNFTKALHKLKKGNKIWFRGPFGKGVFKKKDKNHLLVGGGYGVAPLYFLAEKLLSKSKATVIIGAKTKKELLFEKRFKKLGMKVLVTTEDGSKGRQGLATEAQEKILSEEKIGSVYACGPEPMLEKVVDICKTYRVKYQVSLEAIIKCGFGVCGSCSRGDRLVCQDGPVFSRWPKKRR